MKIIYLHQYFNTPEMSGGTRSFELGSRLVEMGHDVHMVTSWRQRDGRRGWFTTNESGMTVYWLPVPYSNEMSSSARIRAFFSFAVRSSLLATRLDGDVVFATSTPLTIAIPGIAASKLRRRPMVFEVRDLWPELPIAIGALRNPLARTAARLLERLAYKSSRNIVALSPGMKDGVVAARFPEERVTVIPNSSDLSRFAGHDASAVAFRSRHAWLGDRPLVVYTGTLGMINGVSYLVRLAHEVRKHDNDIRFLIVGDGSEREKIRNLAVELGVLNSNLFMMGQVPKNDVPAILAAAHIATSTFVDLRAMWANSANKFFDALASGTPIAINYGGWQAELIESSGSGLVLDPHDVSSASITLVRALRDDTWLQSASQHALSLAHECFDRDLHAKELVAVLQESTSPCSR